MNIVIVGGNGKLGKQIYNALKENSHKIIVVDLNSKVKKLDDINKKLQINAIIDVSNHKNSINSLLFAKEKNVPIIIGCTGHTEEEISKIKSISAKIPIVLAYNFSIALQFFYNAIEILSHLKSVNYLFESHHINKKDKPSGTALEIKKIIELNSTVENIFSIRAGNIVGKHTALFVCDNEEINITHSVFNRKIFADGAIFALNFITKQNNGLYSMKDIIKTQNK